MRVTQVLDGSTDRAGHEPAEVVRLVGAATAAAGVRPLSDQQWLDLTVGGRAEAAVLAAWSADALAGTAHLSGGNASDVVTWNVEIVTDPGLDEAARRAVVDELLDAAVAHLRGHGGGQLHWWTFGDDSAWDVARSHGMRRGRSLHQMRVALPLAAGGQRAVDVRTFRVGEDEGGWLEVNNAAFADHPEQGGWTMDTIRQREREPWFDPAGFLLHHRDGRLAAFCWTKLHHDHDPVLGEIYVIAVHPDFHSLGLGTSMTIAGLDSIAARGVRHGMLYVDGDNAAAFAMYTRLGFETHHTDRAFVIDVRGDA